MLPKKNRLSREKEIKNLLKAGRSIKGNLVDIRYFKSGPGQTRFLFLVSAKTAKKAHERNKIRRYLSEIFFRLLPRLNEYDYALIAKKNIIGKNQRDIENEILGLLEGVGLLAS
ncbi:MAG: ribonuclease P protein component [Candidatus Portnoybacteria bacterium]|nr:ribonuclease P protein component [Candidatus Portnoybacteria bacterium]